EYEILAPCAVNLWFERSKQPSWGLFGGRDGAPPEVWVHRPGHEPEKMLKANGLKVEAGTRLLVKTGGGGGWGDPAERSATDRGRDRRLEMVI
ncbi:MAG: hydantoinase B/oxoprolinase family protein, partial [Acidimicrobiia bacterium]|nr:hydantoinase B/oxoprolinase family protein [Acidimicrobiia bacterium]